MGPVFFFVCCRGRDFETPPNEGTSETNTGKRDANRGRRQIKKNESTRRHRVGPRDPEPSMCRTRYSQRRPAAHGTPSRRGAAHPWTTRHHEMRVDQGGCHQRNSRASNSPSLNNKIVSDGQRDTASTFSPASRPSAAQYWVWSRTSLGQRLVPRGPPRTNLFLDGARFPRVHLGRTES